MSNGKIIPINKIREDLIKAQVEKTIREKFKDMVDATFSLQKRIKQLTGFDLYSNQVEIVECIMADDIKNLTLTGARASGKTFGVLLGLALYSIQHPGLEVGLTAPTDDQSNRMIKTFISKIMSAPGIKEFVVKGKTTNTHVEFTNGAYWDSFSGNETGHQEGRHYDCFPAGTLIATIQGEKGIEEIEIGDLVLSKDVQTGEIKYEVVEAVHSKGSEELIEIEFEINGIIKKVQCTPEHKIMTARGEVKAEDLLENDEIYGII